jgi:RNA 2',3'-cyclic 3'-phosphodiesterase
MPESSPPETLRLFLAISVPEEVKDEMEKAQAELRRALPGDSVRWTKRAQFHLTLKFLGDVAAPRVVELTESLRGACENFAALRLRAEGIGFFPQRGFPRVIWIGLLDAGGELPALQKAVEGAVSGFTREQAEEKFSGHVTLGRARNLRRPQAELLEKLARGLAGRAFGEWRAEEVEIIQSELLSQGSRYTTLATARLAEKL